MRMRLRQFVGGIAPRRANSSPRIWVRGEISDRTASDFKTDLAAFEGLHIDVVVDSIGGQVESALSMAEAVREHGRVTAFYVRADSAALVIGLGAEEVVCAKGSDFLLHEPTIQIPRDVMVTPGEMRGAAAGADDGLVRASRLMEKRSGRPDSFWRLLASEGRRLTAEEMVKWGLANRVSDYTAAELRGQR